MADVKNWAVLPQKEVSYGPKTQFFTVQTFLNCNLSMMHDKMGDLCKKAGIEVEKLPTGNCVLFVNRRANYIKLLVGNESHWPIVAAYRIPGLQRFTLQCVADIAAAFKSDVKVDATLKLRRAMIEHFARKQKSVA